MRGVILKPSLSLHHLSSVSLNILDSFVSPSNKCLGHPNNIEHTSFKVPANDKLTKLRTEQSTPLVFALPASGSEKSEVDYRVMLKKILGV